PLLREQRKTMFRFLSSAVLPRLVCRALPFHTSDEKEDTMSMARECKAHGDETSRGRFFLGCSLVLLVFGCGPGEVDPEADVGTAAEELGTTNSLTINSITTNSITTNSITTNSITTNSITTNSITTNALVNAALLDATLSPDRVTSSGENAAMIIKY